MSKKKYCANIQHFIFDELIILWSQKNIIILISYTMAVKIETIITDSNGNRIIVSQEYSDIVSLVDKNIDQIEDFVLKAKKDISVLAEQELLNLNKTSLILYNNIVPNQL